MGTHLCIIGRCLWLDRQGVGAGVRRWRSRDCVWKPDRHASRCNALSLNYQIVHEYVLHDLLRSHDNVVITTSINCRGKLAACLSIVLELPALFLVSCNQTAGVTVWHRLTDL